MKEIMQLRNVGNTWKEILSSKTISKMLIYNRFVLYWTLKIYKTVNMISVKKASLI